MLRAVTPTCCLLLLFGCKSTTEPPPAASPVASASPVPSAVPSAKPEPEFKGTLGIVEVKRNDYPTLLTSVRTAKHEGYDRIVMEFKDRVPGYHLEYIDKPVRDCGEGKEIPLAGDSWLEIRMYPVDAHTQEGQPTILERKRQLKLPNMLEGQQTCDFEAVVTWVLGVAKPNPYRILELKDPPRLVVDVKQ